MASTPTVDRERALASWARLVRYQRATLQGMDESLRARFGRSLDDYDVLHQVSELSAPVKMGTLADRLVVANSSCTRVVGRLVADGLLARRRGTDDRREVFVSLTADGRRLHRRMAAVHTRDIERLFTTRLSARARAALAGALDELVPPTSDDHPG